MDWSDVFGWLLIGDRLAAGRGRVERVITARTTQEALALAAAEDAIQHRAGYRRVSYAWDLSKPVPTMHITYDVARPAWSSGPAGDIGAMRWVGFGLWVVAAVVVLLISMAVVLFGLYLLDIAMAGAGAARSVYDCSDQGCVTQSWLVGAGLVIGSTIIVGGVIPAFLSSRPTLRLATGLAWLATIGLLLWAFVMATTDADTNGALYALPAASTAVLALGCHIRMRVRAERAPEP